MTKLILEQPLLNALAKVERRVAICDGTGRTVGWFQPISDRDAYEGYECPLGNEELDHIENAQDGRPLVDILHDLEGSA